MHISWREQMAVDHGMIDDDHRQIIAITNEFIDLEGTPFRAADLQRILAKLDRYTKTHLQREQQLQKKIFYPFAEAHEYQHRDLIKRLDAMRAKVKPELADNQLAIVFDDLAQLLRHWFIDHIIHSDLRMRPYAAILRQLSAGAADLAAAVTEHVPIA